MKEMKTETRGTISPSPERLKLKRLTTPNVGKDVYMAKGWRTI